MKKRRYIINLFTAAALLVGCSESLEDTYSDFAGDGKIHYVAKCSEVHVSPRWEGLVLEWQNGTDATIDKVKVVWTFEDQKDSTLLPNTTTSFELKNLVNGTYRFDVCTMDADGNKSLPETTYGRPYTREHEVMLAFSRGVVKPYFLKNKLIFFSDQWNENIEEMILKYKDSNGVQKEYVFDKETSYSTLVTIDDVSMNPADTVYVFRKGKLEDCPDIIEFDPVAISRKKNYSAGFVNAIYRRYGYTTDTKEQEEKFEKFIEEVEELEFDYDIETFEDVLYCPSLKKIVFGKNRYLKSGRPYTPSKVLGPIEKSVQVLNKAHESDVLNLIVECYCGFDSHYFQFGNWGDDALPYMKDMGFSQLPDLDIISADAFERISCTPIDSYADLDFLLDDDPNKKWLASSSVEPRTHEIQMVLTEPMEISGVKVSQYLFDNWDKQAPYRVPSRITMQTSVDGANWKNVTYLEANTLGYGGGEVTLLPIAEGHRLVQYIKFSVRDMVDPGKVWTVSLGDVVLYK